MFRKHIYLKKKINVYPAGNRKRSQRQCKPKLRNLRDAKPEAQMPPFGSSSDSWVAPNPFAGTELAKPRLRSKKEHE